MPGARAVFAAFSVCVQHPGGVDAGAHCLPAARAALETLTCSLLAQAEVAVTVGAQVLNQTASAGVEYFFAVPTSAFNVDGAPLSSLTVSGEVEVTHSSGVGEQGIRVNAGSPGVAHLSGTCTLLGDSWLAVILSAQSSAGGDSEQQTFFIHVIDEPPTVAAAIPTQHATAGSPFDVVVPAGTFTDHITAMEDLHIDGSVSIKEQAGTGGSIGISVTPGAQGAARVSGACMLVGDSVLTVTLTATDAAGKVGEHAFDIAVTDEAPFVVEEIVAQNATAGMEFMFEVPAGTFGDVITPADELHVTGTVQVKDSMGIGGEVGLAVSPGPLGVATVNGTCMVIGDSVLTVVLTATDGGGKSVQHAFDIDVTDEFPLVLAALPDASASAGRPFHLLVTEGIFSDRVTPVAALQVNGVVEVLQGGELGGAVGISVTPGAPGEAVVEGVCSVIGNSTLHVTLVATDEAGQSVESSFHIAVSDAPPVVDNALPAVVTGTAGHPFHFLIPADAFDDDVTASDMLWVTGAVSVDSAHTEPAGIVVMPGAPGLAHVYGTCMLAGDSELTVTLTVRDEAGNTVQAAFAVHFSDEAPVLHSPVPNQQYLSGKPFEFVIPSHTFFDAVTSRAALQVTGVVSVAWGGDHGGEPGLVFTSGALGEARVHGACLLVGDAGVVVELSARDGAGRTVNTSFTIQFVDEAPFVAQPQPHLTINAGAELSVPLPAVGTFGDRVTAEADMDAHGYLSVRAGGDMGGALGMVLMPGKVGDASMDGVSTFIGGAVLRASAAVADATGRLAMNTYDIVVVDQAPEVGTPMEDGAAEAGVAFALDVPESTFIDALTPCHLLDVSGVVELVSNTTSVGEVGITVLPGKLGNASVAGTCTIAGETVLRVHLTAVDEAGGAVQHSFLIHVWDGLPYVANRIANQTVTPNSRFELVVPVDTFGDVLSPAAALVVDGEVALVQNTSRWWQGGDYDMIVTAGAPGEAMVSGTTTLAAGSKLRAHLRVRDEAGQEAETSFDITVEDTVRRRNSGAIAGVAVATGILVVLFLVLMLRPKWFGLGGNSAAPRPIQPLRNGAGLASQL